jgi:flagellar biosynthesis protein FliQ
VIGFSLRLAVAGGREAVGRLTIIAAAVALGVGLLLSVVSAVNAVNAQNQRYAWLNTGLARSTAAPAPDALWWSTGDDFYHGEEIGRVDVGATGPHAPELPGIGVPPGPGEYYASPALARLLRTVPADELGSRYPGHLVGEIGAAALPSPGSLLIVIGHTPEEAHHLDRAQEVRAIQGTSPDDCADCVIGLRAAGLDLLLGVVAGAMLFPVLMLIGTATRLSAARREQRFAAMRLVGATPRQIAVIAAVEAALSALGGTAVGFALYYGFRDKVAAIPFTGSAFFPSDLTLGPVAIVAVAIGVPLAAALVARLSLRRVQISPLGVTRRATPRPPRAYRLIPLGLGLAELAYFVGRRPQTSIGQTEAYLPGMLVIMAGLVIAGPWLTMVGARLVARRASRPAALVAARRLGDDPRAGFRSVSGLILALFVTTVATGVITTIVDHRGGATSGPSVTNVVQQMPQDPDLVPSANPVPPGLRTLPGVAAVAVTHRLDLDHMVPGGGSYPQYQFDDVVACADLVGQPEFGRCPAGAETAGVFTFLGPDDTTAVTPVWPAAPYTRGQIEALPAGSVVVATDGRPATIERVRTMLEAANRSGQPAATEHEFDSRSTNLLKQWKQLASVTVITSLVLAGCSLAVGVAGGLTERKRPFSLLRLTGVPLATLRRTVALETAVPLLAAAVVAIGVGLLAAHLFLTAQMDYALRWLGFGYVATVAAGLAVSLAIVAATFPLLRRITGPETARND